MCELPTLQRNMVLSLCIFTEWLGHIMVIRMAAKCSVIAQWAHEKVIAVAGMELAYAWPR